MTDHLFFHEWTIPLIQGLMCKTLNCIK